MRGKKEKKGREKEEKKRRKGGNNWGPNRKKKKKKKKEVEEVRAHLFPLRSRHFLDQSEIRYLEKKHTIFTFVFMQDFFDEQIM